MERMTDKKKVQQVARDTRWIWKNLLLGVAFVLVLGILTAWALGLITRHGKIVKTPDFSSLTVQQAQKLAAASHVKVKVVDSVFVRRLSGGVVYRQQPKAGSTVKKGRKYLLGKDIAAAIVAKVEDYVLHPGIFELPCDGGQVFAGTGRETGVMQIADIPSCV